VAADDGGVSAHRVVIVVRDGIQSLDALGPLEVFHAAGEVAGSGGYEVVVAAPEAGVVRAESGVGIVADVALGSVRRVDTLVVAGGRGVRHAVDDAAYVGQVRRLAGRAGRVTSVCTGAAALAAAGVLDGRRAATHWAWTDWLARRWPAVEVEPDAIFVQDGHVWTSAGVTAGMDLALALVAADHGPEVAHAVAGWLVMFVRRGGGQSQFSPQLRAAAPRHPSLRSLLATLPDRLAEDLSVARLAADAGMSPRTFARAFRAELGVTPGAHVEELRVDATRRLLETTDLTVAAIARQVGFGRPETLHRSFRRRVGTTPDAYRRHFAPV
jgi:transcriptional regulator GlxA family with amidase domain